MSEVAINTEEQVIETPIANTEVDNAQELPKDLEETAVEAAPKEQAQVEQKVVEITEDAVMAMLKERGIMSADATSLDALKPKIELTAEQLSAEELQKEKTLLDKHVASGRKIDEFTQLKTLSKANAVDIALSVEKNNLLEAGFTQQQADQLLKEKYIQYTESELQEFDEDEIAEITKKKELYAKQLETNGLVYINDAKNYLDNLQKNVDLENLEKEVDANIATSVVEKAKSLPRTISIPLNELGEKLGLESIVIDLDEEEIGNASKVLSEKASREKLLFNKDGSEKAEDYLELLAIKNSLPKMIAQAVLKASQLQAEILTKAMPNDAKQLQQNSINNGTASVGKKIGKGGMVVGSMVVRN